jgi:hypothetical protein
MKQKNQIFVLVVLLVILAGVFWYVNHSAPSGKLTTSNLTHAYAPLGVESPAPRFWEIERARKTDYSRTMRNIFNPNAPPPEPDKNTPVAPTTPRGKVGPPVPPVPVPPTLPLTFFGYGTVPNGTSRRAFLINSSKEDIYIVAEGETLLGRFRVLRINNASLEFEEISTGLKNTSPLNLEEASAGAVPVPPPAPSPTPAPTS